MAAAAAAQGRLTALLEGWRARGLARRSSRRRSRCAGQLRSDGARVHPADGWRSHRRRRALVNASIMLSAAHVMALPRVPLTPRPQEEQAHKELLQQQLATLGAASRRLATAAGGAARASEQQRRGIAGALRAASLRAAQAAAADAAHELECELQQLGRALTEWAELAEGSAPPGAEWLLATADASGYAARDAEAQELISRCGARRMMEQGVCGHVGCACRFGGQVQLPAWAAALLHGPPTAG